MEASTHIVGGFLAGMILSSVSLLDPIFVAGTCTVATISSLIPDIDLCTSKMGHRTKPVSFVISRLFGHRTLFHSPILYIAIYCLMTKYLARYEWLIAAFAIGIASHLFLDMLNRKGIPLFYPVSKHYHLATIKCGGRGELALRIMLALMSCVVFLILLARG